MKKLFLTSSVHAVAQNIASRLDLSLNNKLVFIVTPTEPESESEDLSWLDNDRNSLIKAGFNVTDYTITNKNKDQLIADLSEYDYIYMSGGNTLYLLEQSQKSGFIEVIKDLIYKKGKTYIGTSAGSIITGPKCPDYLLAEDETLKIENKDGYGFVNFTVVPHWGSKHFKDLYLKGRLEIAYKENQVPLLVLTDNQYVAIIDDKMEIVDVSV